MTKGMRKYFKKKIFWFVITLVAAVILNFIHSGADSGTDCIL